MIAWGARRASLEAGDLRLADGYMVHGEGSFFLDLYGECLFVLYELEFNLVCVENEEG